ncbi:DUF4292 domain-containing protein [Frigoriflavimonas asaccharolytica]|uniref:Putative small lipoprotein YifL n=1 Tax=Frigoriflavimonas asaccharolytica TaxID=2735899 RepID=A0A8J8G8Y7_9FLAO|nr:DUF4292 domain-containing protein [Frigoriflavimonas asaccharolytica]NRS93643.1 putative small lipoprotein YifL [Frigoriflavimonas asaccharolytica]
MKKWLFVLSFLLILQSCKTKKPLLDEEGNVVETKKEDRKPKEANYAIADKIMFFTKTIPPLKFDQIKISSKVDVESGSSVPTLDATIYIENNEKIWSNLTALFFSVARAQATQEGFKAMDRINKNYIDSDYEYLNKLLNVNFIDYNSLQKILMGRTFISINDSKFILSQNTQGFKVVSAYNQKIANDEVEKAREYAITLLYNKEYDLTNVLLQDVLSNDELEISYDNWDTFENLRLPQNVKIIIKGEKTSKILIENTKFDFSKIKTPYTVPNSYQQIEIND